jgi:hypothetical protein
MKALASITNGLKRLMETRGRCPKQSGMTFHYSRQDRNYFSCRRFLQRDRLATHSISLLMGRRIHVIQALIGKQPLEGFPNLHSLVD